MRQRLWRGAVLSNVTVSTVMRLSRSSKSQAGRKVQERRYLFTKTSPTWGSFWFFSQFGKQSVEFEDCEYDDVYPQTPNLYTLRWLSALLSNFVDQSSHLLSRSPWTLSRPSERALAGLLPAKATDSLQHEIVISSKRRATYMSIVCLSPGRKNGSVTGGVYNSRVLVNFSSMFVGRAYKLTKRSKSTLAVKLLGIRFLRRYFVVFGVRDIVLRLCGDTYNFKNLWHTLSKPLEEIFFHPLGHYLVGDLSFRLQSGPQSSHASKQSKDFFSLQYGKFAKHYEGLAPSGQFDSLWLEFCRKFLFDCREVTGLSNAISRVF